MCSVLECTVIKCGMCDCSVCSCSVPVRAASKPGAVYYSQRAWMHHYRGAAACVAAVYACVQRVSLSVSVWASCVYVQRVCIGIVFVRAAGLDAP
jgi:hypothetical protein